MEHGLNDLENRIELSFLYDFYGALLKENQQKIFEAYMLEDYSLAEVAAQCGISRQGVYDTVRRCSRQLRDYEEKLGLAAKFQEQKAQIARVHELLHPANTVDADVLAQAVSLMEKILEDA